MIIYIIKINGENKYYTETKRQAQEIMEFYTNQYANDLSDKWVKIHKTTDEMSSVISTQTLSNYYLYNGSIVPKVKIEIEPLNMYGEMTMNEGNLLSPDVLTAIVERRSRSSNARS